ncbi:MAG: lactate racemase domain-containing protein, partial [Dehalococcoidia bacterium]
MGSRPLAEIVGPDDHVAIVFSDLTRPTPNAIIAPELLRVIEGEGVPRGQITLIVGAGLHRGMTQEELERLLGAEIARSYRIVVHDARDPDSQIFLERYPGERRGGIYLNAHFMRASVRIVTGFVEPHLFAGYSGGGKGVFPGVASAHNIMRNHGVANLAHPNATYCVTEGNPVFEECRRVALAAGVSMLCNVTMNAAKQVTGVYCGDLTVAHDAAIEQLNRQALRPVPRAYDIVVGSNAGYPADL